MKTNHLKALVAALVLTSYAGFASAAGNTTVQVKASVNAVCQFTATSMAAIDLGAIDPSAVPAAGVTNVGDVTYQCTNKTVPSVGIVSGGTSLSDGATTPNTIAYSFSLGTPGAGKGFGASSTAKVVGTATISQAAAQAAAAGAYTDTVTLSINN